MWLYSPVCVGPGRKPRRPVFSERGSNVTRYASIFTPILKISFTYPHFFHICVSTHLDKTPLRYSNPRTLELMKNIMRNAQLYFSGVNFFTPVNPENKFHSILLYFSVTSIFAPFLSASQNSFFFRSYT